MTDVFAQEPTIPPPDKRTKIRAFHTTRPEYPDSLRAKHIGGAGVFLLRVDTKTGKVTSVDIQKSTGIAQLDESCIAAYRQWRFQPPVSSKVKIPTRFDPARKVPIIGQTY